MVLLVTIAVFISACGNNNTPTNSASTTATPTATSTLILIATSTPTPLPINIIVNNNAFVLGGDIAFSMDNASPVSVGTNYTFTTYTPGLHTFTIQCFSVIAPYNYSISISPTCGLPVTTSPLFSGYDYYINVSSSSVTTVLGNGQKQFAYYFNWTNP